MKAPVARVGAVLLLALAGCAPFGPKPESGDKGAAVTGRYRNLFAETGHAPDEVSERCEAAFQQLFHGDPATQAVYFPAGTNGNGPLAFIADVLHNDVRSEGMSYGMMIAVQLDRKPEFDALWNWARSEMHHASRSHPAHGYFSWCLRTNGAPIDEMPAPDGEEYFATALYFAAGRWTNGAGIYNYRAEADALLKNLLHREPIVGHAAGEPKTAGAIFDNERHMVRFTPEFENRDHTDPSYHLPAFYEFWARCGPPADRAFWREAARVSRDFFRRAAHPSTGLAPDYAHFDGTPWAPPWNRHSADFSFDSWRTAMNWSVDWAWWAADPREQQLSDRLQAFFESKGIGVYGNQFTLDGRQLGEDHSPGLVSANAVASLAATEPRAEDFVEALWNLPVPAGENRYYDGMLYLLAMLHCSGQFRVWMPQ
jgi:oligosaccharide reducing-end xylanase